MSSVPGDVALTQIEAAMPRWRAWRGVGRTGLYASRYLTSPVKVVRGPTPAAVIDAILEAGTRWATLSSTDLGKQCP